MPNQFYGNKLIWTEFQSVAFKGVNNNLQCELE